MGEAVAEVLKAIREFVRARARRSPDDTIGTLEFAITYRELDRLFDEKPDDPRVRAFVHMMLSGMARMLEEGIAKVEGCGGEGGSRPALVRQGYACHEGVPRGANQARLHDP